MTKTKLTAAQREALVVLEQQNGHTVRVSNRTRRAGRGPDGAEPTVYWQTATSLAARGLATEHWFDGAQWARLTPAGEALVEAGGHR